MSRREQDPQPRHPVDPSRRRHIEDPDKYKEGKEAGDREREQGRFHTDGDTPNFVGHCRRPVAIAAVVVLLVCFPVALPLAAFCAVALLATPRSGHLGKRHKDPRHERGDWWPGGDDQRTDQLPPKLQPPTPSSKGKR